MKYLIFVSLVFVFACEPSKSEEIKKIKKEALVIHDEVMPKMGALRRARKDLMLQADSLIEVDSVKAQMLMTASDEIARANESMMNWMRNYDPEFEGTEEEKLIYFKEQRASIDQVRTAMNESLTKGNEILK